MVFDRYLMKNLLLATLFTALSLAAVIMLTQSLRFLELIINSGASSLSFFALTFLALPRFFEVILPIALMIGVVFIYNRMTTDSEIVVMRASGLSPMRLGQPAFALAIGLRWSCRMRRSSSSPSLRHGRSEQSSRRRIRSTPIASSRNRWPRASRRRSSR